jgi:hypothetical protein
MAEACAKQTMVITSSSYVTDSKITCSLLSSPASLHRSYLAVCLGDADAEDECIFD